MNCEHCGYRRAMRGFIVCKKCLREFGGSKWFHEPDASLNATPLYTTPPQRKPLTDEQKMALCKQFPDHLTFNAIHAIEAAHNIKE